MEREPSPLDDNARGSNANSGVTNIPGVAPPQEEGVDALLYGETGSNIFAAVARGGDGVRDEEAELLIQH